MKILSRHRTSRDDGAALPLALVLTLIAMIIGSSLMLLAQTETYASMNYQSMTQARFAAESGVHKAINYLLNDYQGPGSTGDPFNAYTVTTAPVKYNNNAVVLSARSNVSPNYPVAATQTAFNAAAQGNLAVGSATVSYAASARLLTMRQVSGYGTGTLSAVQTWLITAVGTTGGSRPATVEVSATLERQAMPFNLYGLFATAATCGALSFSGGVVTDSYNSSSMTFVNGKPVTTPNGGNVGTNGNLTEGGGSVVNGTLSTPRTGVGNCTSGAVDALTQNGNAQVTGGIIQLPQAVSYATPAPPSPAPPTGNQNITGTANCSTAGFSGGICSGTGGVLTLTPAGGVPIRAADLKLTAGATLRLNAGTYEFNSISLQGNSQVIIESGPVVMNIMGAGQTNPVDFSGGSVSNTSFIPKRFQILYGGTGGVKVSGGSATALMVFAPNAAVSLTGGSGIYGSVLGKTISDTGGTAIHYDRDLPTEFTLAWNTMLSSFTWKKY